MYLLLLRLGGFEFRVCLLIIYYESLRHACLDKHYSVAFEIHVQPQLHVYVQGQTKIWTAGKTCQNIKNSVENKEYVQSHSQQNGTL